VNVTTHHDLVVRLRTAVPWLRRLAAGLPPRRFGADLGSVHVGFVVDKLALGQVFLQVLPFSSVTFNSIVTPLHGKRKRLLIFITGLHNKPQGCGAPVTFAVGPFTIKTKVSE
jgi:hypothetical protein